VGDARIGIAISDPTGLIAIPLEVMLRRDGDVLARMKEIVESNEAKCVVAGLPKNMDGTEGVQARLTRQFVDRLEKILPDLTFVFRDERLSTQAARGMRLERGSKKGQRRKAIDSEAAAIILQNYLDFLKLHKPQEHRG
jgi:putative Holliday junction resolvase